MKSRSFLDMCIDTLVGDHKFTKNYRDCDEMTYKANLAFYYCSPFYPKPSPTKVRLFIETAKKYYQKMERELERYSPFQPYKYYQRLSRRLRRNLNDLCIKNGVKGVVQ